MRPFPFVDAHVHFWDPQRLEYSWLAGVPALNRAFLPTHLTNASPLQPEALVFVEAGRHPRQNLDEVRWVEELAAGDPRVRGIVAHASLERGAAVTPDLDALAAHPRVKGVRRLLQDETDPAFCLSPEFIEATRQLARRKLSLDLCIRHPQLRSVTELVRRCPEVTFVLDHLGKPAVRERQLDPWRRELAALARLPNVWCKLSGLATEADHTAWRPEDLRPYIDHVITSFGWERVLFGGDWPVSTLATSYTRWIETLAEAVAGASEPQRDALFRANAVRCYRL